MLPPRQIGQTYEDRAFKALQRAESNKLEVEGNAIEVAYYLTEALVFAILAASRDVCDAIRDHQEGK
jgi:hypothetical protein